MKNQMEYSARFSKKCKDTLYENFYKNVSTILNECIEKIEIEKRRAFNADRLLKTDVYKEIIKINKKNENEN